MSLATVPRHRVSSSGLRASTPLSLQEVRMDNAAAPRWERQMNWRPPSTTSVWPVIMAAASEARKIAAPTRSSGWSARLIAAARNAVGGGVVHQLRAGLGEREARRERVDANPVAAELPGEHACDGDQRARRREVVGEQRRSALIVADGTLTTSPP
jgi:hypothetical protein